MEAIVIRRHGGVEVLERTEWPDPVAATGEVVIRVHAAAVNPADHKWRAGMFASFMPVSFPHVLGYDVAGEVLSGEGIAVGTRVFGMLDPFRKGGYAQRVATAASMLALIPESMDYATAAAIPTAGLAGLQMVERGLDVQPGQCLLITGALGAVGRFALHAAKARGARIIASVRPEHRAAALALGADSALSLGQERWTGAPFDHVLDTVGGAAVGALCGALAAGGRILTAATDPIPADGLPAVPKFFAVTPDGADLARLAQAVAAGLVTASVARTVPLDEAAAAHELVERGGLGGKVILIPPQ